MSEEKREPLSIKAILAQAAMLIFASLAEIDRIDSIVRDLFRQIG